MNGNLYTYNAIVHYDTNIFIFAEFLSAVESYAHILRDISYQICLSSYLNLIKTSLLSTAIPRWKHQFSSDHWS